MANRLSSTPPHGTDATCARNLRAAGAETFDPSPLVCNAALLLCANSDRRIQHEPHRTAQLLLLRGSGWVPERGEGEADLRWKVVVWLHGPVGVIERAPDRMPIEIAYVEVASLSWADPGP